MRLQNDGYTQGSEIQLHGTKYMVQNTGEVNKKFSLNVQFSSGQCNRHLANIIGFRHLLCCVTKSSVMHE